MKKKRVLLISCSVIMLCVCIVAGMSYALFTDYIKVTNHLQAGNLEATLYRTNLKYAVLNDNGELAEKTSSDKIDLTNTNTGTANVFGLDTSNIRIAPGSYFEATLQIANEGNTAFDYVVNIVLDEDTNNALAQQLKVTFTDHDGKTQSCKLSELDAGKQFDSAKLFKGKTGEFKVRIEFIDAASNNAAQELSVNFDLTVSATQATTKSN